MRTRGVAVAGLSILALAGMFLFVWALESDQGTAAGAASAVASIATLAVCAFAARELVRRWGSAPRFATGRLFGVAAGAVLYVALAIVAFAFNANWNGMPLEAFMVSWPGFLASDVSCSAFSYGCPSV